MREKQKKKKKKSFLCFAWPTRCTRGAERTSCCLLLGGNREAIICRYFDEDRVSRSDIEGIDRVNRLSD